MLKLLDESVDLNERLLRVAKANQSRLSLVAKRVDKAHATLAEVPPQQRDLGHFPEPALAALGLTSPQRLALLTLNSWHDQLAPRLRRLGLLID